MVLSFLNSKPSNQDFRQTLQPTRYIESMRSIRVHEVISTKLKLYGGVATYMKKRVIPPIDGKKCNSFNWKNVSREHVEHLQLSSVHAEACLSKSGNN